jgi:hypothetical protein
LAVCVRQAGREPDSYGMSFRRSLFVFFIERPRLRSHLLWRARTRRRLLRNTVHRPATAPLLFGIRFEHRAAIIGKLRRVLPQTCHDPADVRDLIGAEPPDVRRTGHLLFPRSAIFLG